MLRDFSKPVTPLVYKFILDDPQAAPPPGRPAGPPRAG